MNAPHAILGVVPDALARELLALPTTVVTGEDRRIVAFAVVDADGRPVLEHVRLELVAERRVRRDDLDSYACSVVYDGDDAAHVECTFTALAEGRLVAIDRWDLSPTRALRALQSGERFRIGRFYLARPRAAIVSAGILGERVVRDERAVNAGGSR